MSLEEMIKLASLIVKGERFKMPQLKPWELDEVIWWTHNLDGSLV